MNKILNWKYNHFSCFIFKEIQYIILRKIQQSKENFSSANSQFAILIEIRTKLSNSLKSLRAPSVQIVLRILW